MKKILLVSIGLFLLSMLYSCGPASYTVTARPSYEIGIRPNSPGIGYVWIDGDWYWSGGAYVYREGHWGRHRGHRTWHSGEWRQHGNGWYWRKGKWH